MPHYYYILFDEVTETIGSDDVVSETHNSKILCCVSIVLSFS
jgi:hypothetical protein